MAASHENRCGYSSGPRYLARRYPPPISHTKRIVASRNGFAPACLNFSMPVSAPRAVMAMVRRKVSRLLMNSTAEAGSRPSELNPMTAMNPKANHGMVTFLFSPYHLDYYGSVGDVFSHCIAGPDHMCHLMQSGAGVYAHPGLVERNGSGIVQGRVDEHGYCPENHYRGYGYCCLVRLWTDNGFCAEDSRGSADGASGGGQQGYVFVHFKEFPGRYPEQQGQYDHNQVYDHSFRPYRDYALESEPEPVQYYAYAENLFRAELYSRDPCLREVVPEGICVQHPQYYPYDKRAE